MTCNLMPLTVLVFLIIWVFGIPNVVAQEDVTSLFCPILVPDLPGFITEKPEGCETIPTEELANNLLNGEWKTFNSTICNMSVDYPANFTVVEKENRFDKKLPFMIFLDEPTLNFVVNCGKSDPFFPNVTAEDMDILVIETLQYDNFLVEDANMTKWKLDNKTTGSFVYGSTNDESLITFAHEYLFTNHGGKDVLINFMTKAEDFDIPEIQELEKRMFNSIEFYH